MQRDLFTYLGVVVTGERDSAITRVTYAMQAETYDDDDLLVEEALIGAFSPNCGDTA